jgi:hypothetical protein
MPDGSLTIPPAVLQVSRPSLAETLEQLIACAGRGARPDAVLHDIRSLMRDHGLLIRGGGDAG